MFIKQNTWEKWVYVGKWLSLIFAIKVSQQPNRLLKDIMQKKKIIIQKYKDTQNGRLSLLSSSHLTKKLYMTKYFPKKPQNIIPRRVYIYIYILDK